MLLSSLVVLVAPAHAEDLFDGQLVEMLPAGLISGDGSTPVTLQVVAVDAAGQALPSSAKWTIKASDGDISLSDAGERILTFSYTPPAVDAVTSVTLDLKGRSSDLEETITRSWQVTVSPPLPTAMSTSSSPDELVLGQDTSATVSVTLDGGANQPAAGAALLTRSSSGELTNMTHLGGGRFSARLELPDVQYPHLGVLTFADERSPDTLYGYQVVRYVGKADYPVSTEPNATVMLRIEDREFGPIQADDSGSAIVPISVPPGVEQGTLVSIVNGVTSEFPMDLEVPSTRRLAFFPVAKGIPADGATAVPIRVAVTRAGGEAANKASLELTATAGTVGPATHEGNGIYVAQYTPPLMNAASEATLQVSLGGDAVQSDSITVQLTPTLPSGIALSTDAASLSANGSGFTVYAKVTGPDEGGLDGRDLSFGANGAKLKGDVSDLTGGDYQATFSTTGSSNVELTGTVHTAPTGNPVRGVVVLPARDTLPPDGLSSSMITVVAVDQFGYPVADVPVALSVAAGGGTVPESVTTDANGTAQVYYTSGRDSGVVSLVATAGDAVGGAAMLQVPADTELGLELPASGSAWTAGVHDAWDGIVQSLVVPREGAQGAFLSAPAAAPTAGPLTGLALAAAASSVAPGGTVTVNIQAKDENGVSVAGASLEAMAMPGTASAVNEVGDGAYAVTVTAPQGTGITEVKLVVSTADGAIARVLKVPVKAASASPWGAATAAVEAPADEAPAETEEAVTEEPAAETAVAETEATDEPEELGAELELPWLRLRAGAAIGSYTYSQTPTEIDGPLWNQGLSFEVPARQGGGAIDATAWLPMLDWVGADVEARFTYYSAIWPNAAETVVPDLVPHVTALGAARYAFQSGQNQFHVAGKLGMVYGDFITYTKGENATQLQYAALGVAGFGLGAEVGGEISELLFFKAGIVEGLRGTIPFNTNVDLELGYVVTDNLYASASYALSNRSIEILADPAEVVVGRLEDNSSIFVVGVGYQL